MVDSCAHIRSIRRSKIKICTTCNLEKEFSEFYKRSNSSDGYQSTCKFCRKTIDAASYIKYEHRRESIKDRRDKLREDNLKFMRRYKSFCGCSVCAEREPVALDLHHLDPLLKEDSPASLLGWSRESLKAEIRKCVVLCSNCHRKFHAGIISLPIPEFNSWWRHQFHHTNKN